MFYKFLFRIEKYVVILKYYLKKTFNICNKNHFLFKGFRYKFLTQFYINVFFKSFRIRFANFSRFFHVSKFQTFVHVTRDRQRVERSITIDIPNGKPTRLHSALDGFAYNHGHISYRLPVKVYVYDSRYTEYWPPRNSESLRIKRAKTCDVFILSADKTR